MLDQDKTADVRLEFREGKTGLIYATSPDMPGLLVGRPTMEELRAAIPQAIRDLREATNDAR